VRRKGAVYHQRRDQADALLLATSVRLRALAVGASALALVLAVFLGIAAPPSDFVPKSSVWWELEPAMFPLLFSGVLLSLLALAFTGLATRLRVGAIFCLLAALATASGLGVAEGISAKVAWSFDAACLTLLAIPFVVAVVVLTRRHG
jgi:hypothetical protein